MDRTWIVAHDFSDLAKRALAYGAAQLSALGGGPGQPSGPSARGRLLIVHVRAPRGPSYGADGMPMAPAFDDVEEDIVAAIDKQLAAVAASVHGLEVTTRIESGAPGEVIAELADTIGAEQIVIGSHGRRGLGRLFLGSVAEQVLRRSNVPVLVVKT